MSSHKPFIALCDCNAETVKVDLFVTADDVDGYVSFSSWWQQNRPWRDRLRLAWLALRGKEYYFAEVILDREDTEQLAWYLIRQLGLNVVRFTPTGQSCTGNANSTFTVTGSVE